MRCRQCAHEAGLPDGDFHNINRRDHMFVMCEGCGPDCCVDFTGECVSPICFKHHGSTDEKNDDIVMQERAILTDMLTQAEIDNGPHADLGTIPIDYRDDSLPNQVLDRGTD